MLVKEFKGLMTGELTEGSSVTGFVLVYRPLVIGAGRIHITLKEAGVAVASISLKLGDITAETLVMQGQVNGSNPTAPAAGNSASFLNYNLTTGVSYTVEVEVAGKVDCEFLDGLSGKGPVRGTLRGSGAFFAASTRTMDELG